MGFNQGFKGLKAAFIKYEAINPLNAVLNPICHLLTFLGAHHILHISRIRVNQLSFRNQDIQYNSSRKLAVLPYGKFIQQLAQSVLMCQFIQQPAQTVLMCQFIQQLAQTVLMCQFIQQLAQTVLMCQFKVTLQLQCRAWLYL